MVGVFVTVCVTRTVLVVRAAVLFAPWKWPGKVTVGVIVVVWVRRMVVVPLPVLVWAWSSPLWGMQRARGEEKGAELQEIHKELHKQPETWNMTARLPCNEYCI